MSSKLASAVKIESDHDYKRLECLIAERIVAHRGTLFTTNATGLFEAYLEGIPGEGVEVDKNSPTGTVKYSGPRQHYNCRCCRKFIEKYGGLVTITPEGVTKPALWPIDSTSTWMPLFFSNSISNLWEKVRRAKITGVFLSSDEAWGTSITGEWTHLHGRPCSTFHVSTKTSEQAMAEKEQDFIMLSQALPAYPNFVIKGAIRVLEADVLDRSEKTLGLAKWFLARHGENVNQRWLAVATAPPGFCHIKSTMISTLLDDIASGMEFEAIKRRWDEKMHPLKYHRTDPEKVSEGTIKQAEAILEKLGTAGALARRFAKLEEITAFWTPRRTHDEKMEAYAKQYGAKEGVFDHLKKPEGIKPVLLPPTKISWAKFERTVLPYAAKIEAYIPGSPQAFCGLITAVDPLAPPILQWDGLVERGSDVHGLATPLPRNPVSWYFYANGSYATGWNLKPGTWVAVNALCWMPYIWQQPEKFKHIREQFVLILDGCRDVNYKGVRGGFFTESLKSEYHGIRSVLEAHARSDRGLVAGQAEATACGLGFQHGDNQPTTVRVLRQTGRVERENDSQAWDRYELISWD